MHKNFNSRQTSLSIIAIFATLAETFGTIVLKFLPLEIQYIFVWFVIFFPVLLVILFFIILYKKPENFYSPYDYRSDEAYLKNSAKYTINQFSEIEDIIVNNPFLSNNAKTKVQKNIEESKNEIIKETDTNNINDLTININGTTIKAPSVKSFYTKIFEYLTNHKIDFSSKVPYTTGYARYLINTEPTHQNKVPFWSPLIYNNYYIETRKGKVEAKRDITKFLKDLKLNVKD